MNGNDLITRREVELVLLEKGQRSRRYKLGEIWELNFDDIREALSEYQPKIARCRDCEHCYYASNRAPSERTYACDKHGIDVKPDWFCADGDRGNVK